LKFYRYTKNIFSPHLLHSVNGILLISTIIKRIIIIKFQGYMLKKFFNNTGKLCLNQIQVQ